MDFVDFNIFGFLLVCVFFKIVNVFKKYTATSRAAHRALLSGRRTSWKEGTKAAPGCTLHY